MFEFLGFTHICGRTWKSGKFTVQRKTAGKRMRVKLGAIKAELRRRMHDPIGQSGDCNYHAVPGNLPTVICPC